MPDKTMPGVVLVPAPLGNRRMPIGASRSSNSSGGGGGLTRRRALATLAGLAALGAGARGPALGAVAAAAPTPEAFVRDFAAGVLAILRDPALSPPERLREIDRRVSAGFALDRIGRIALGRYWKAASAAEREEFLGLFKESVLASYGRRFGEYAERRLRVAATAPSGDQVSVESYLEGGREPIRLDWRLAAVGDGGGWRVLDVTVEGISLLVTYRNEFAAVIERSGGRVSALIDELRGRAAAAARGPESTG